MLTRRFSQGLLTLVVAFVAVACSDDDPVAPEQLDIVETALAADNFETLVTAVEAAGLTETLQGEGPFTVFAPTDAAFASLPAGTVDSLLEEDNRDLLVAILTYHVAPERLLAENVLAKETIPTVQGEALTVSLDGSTAKVDACAIVQTDIIASNGVIHVIDCVLIPS